jgi:predicted metal-binding protein
MEQFFKLVDPVIDKRVIELCKKPYGCNKHGCINWDHKKGCPPNIETVEKILDLSKPILVVWNVYPYGENADRLQSIHPEWSRKQCECSRYWQGTARKQLKEKVKIFNIIFPDLYVLWTPEATGVHVHKTMKRIGIKLEWPPKKFAHTVVLAGTKL